jgi:hypothetical protein
MRILFCLAGIVLLGGCATPAPPAPPREPEPARARAALALVAVQNGTAERLAVAYRLTTRAAAEVVVGAVDPGATAELAPLPAGEPLVLIARTPAGAWMALPPRSFAIGDVWTWRIAAGATFQPPGTP